MHETQNDYHGRQKMREREIEREGEGGGCNRSQSVDIVRLADDFSGHTEILLSSNNNNNGHL